MRSRWKTAADDVLREIFGRAPRDISDKDLRHVLIDAYPFGERKHWPYTCWLSRRRAWLYAFRAGIVPPVEPARRRVLAQTLDRETLPMNLT